MKKFALSFILMFSAIFGRFAFASNLDQIVGSNGKMSDSSITISGDALNTTNTVPGIIANVIKVLLGLFGVIALVFVIWGGISWMMSKGDASKIKAAKDRMIAAFIGLAIIAVSYSITDFVITQIVAITSK